MKPPPFRYARCATPADAVTLLSEAGEDAKVLAGGQSLVPLLNFRLARPALLVDVNPLEELAFVREEADGALCIGALFRQVALEATNLGARWQAITDAMPRVGHYPTRVRGTVGGSIAHADPAAELPLLCVGFGARFALVGPAGERSVEVDDFFLGPFTTAVAPDELLTRVSLDPPPDGAVSAFEEFSERHGDFALVSAFVGLALVDGRCSWCRVAIGGVGPTPTRVPDAERALADSGLADAELGIAADASARCCTTGGDVHCSAPTRRELVREVTLRALLRARGRLTDRMGSKA
ncbi:MAG TPA: FAD binding domain-containing protein [Acidimicrobiales bacterium]|nr:FAD binding domain-containing protein [Acidimicrobiales bacterium]